MTINYINYMKYYNKKQNVNSLKLNVYSLQSGKEQKQKKREQRNRPVLPQPSSKN